MKSLSTPTVKRPTRGQIVTIGSASPGTIVGWHFDGVDYPGQEMSMREQVLTLRRLSGWTLPELMLISRLSKVTGHDEARDFANSLRDLP